MTWLYPGADTESAMADKQEKEEKKADEVTAATEEASDESNNHQAKYEKGIISQINFVR